MANSMVAAGGGGVALFNDAHSFMRNVSDEVLEEVTEMKRMSRRDDSQQQQQINHLIADFDRLKENLFAVQSSWGKLVNNCVSPALQENVKQAELEAQEQQKQQQVAATPSRPTMPSSPMMAPRAGETPARASSFGRGSFPRH